MSYRRTGFLASAVVTAVAALGAAAPVATAAAPAKVKLQHSSSPAASRTLSVGDVPASTSILFSVNLALSDPQGAQSLHVTRGYDNMTGLGAPNSGFVGSLVAAAK